MSEAESKAQDMKAQAETQAKNIMNQGRQAAQSRLGGVGLSMDGSYEAKAVTGSETIMRQTTTDDDKRKAAEEAAKKAAEEALKEAALKLLAEMQKKVQEMIEAAKRGAWAEVEAARQAIEQMVTNYGNTINEITSNILGENKQLVENFSMQMSLQVKQTIQVINSFASALKNHPELANNEQISYLMKGQSQILTTMGTAMTGAALLENNVQQFGGNGDRYVVPKWLSDAVFGASPFPVPDEVAFRTGPTAVAGSWAETGANGFGNLSYGLDLIDVGIETLGATAAWGSFLTSQGASTPVSLLIGAATNISDIPQTISWGSVLTSDLFHGRTSIEPNPNGQLTFRIGTDSMVSTLSLLPGGLNPEPATSALWDASVLLGYTTPRYFGVGGPWSRDSMEIIYNKQPEKPQLPIILKDGPEQTPTPGPTSSPTYPPTWTPTTTPQPSPTSTRVVPPPNSYSNSTTHINSAT